jgi:hypothetical protein
LRRDPRQNRKRYEGKISRIEAADQPAIQSVVTWTGVRRIEARPAAGLKVVYDDREGGYLAGRDLKFSIILF